MCAAVASSTQSLCQRHPDASSADARSAVACSPPRHSAGPASPAWLAAQACSRMGQQHSQQEEVALVRLVEVKALRSEAFDLYLSLRGGDRAACAAAWDHYCRLAAEQDALVAFGSEYPSGWATPTPVQQHKGAVNPTQLLVWYHRLGTGHGAQRSSTGHSWGHDVDISSTQCCFPDCGLRLCALTPSALHWIPPALLQVPCAPANPCPCPTRPLPSACHSRRSQTVSPWQPHALLGAVHGSALE